MYKVLLAEDEVIVRLGIKSMIDWNKLDLEVVADVGNGHQALDAYHKHRPDLIITDLRMPVMDGLSLIRKIREQDSDVLIIILTCLDEFKMVQEAIGLNVFNYILKMSAGVDEITSMLQKAVLYMNERQIQTDPRRWISRRAVIGQILDDYMLYGRLTLHAFREFVNQTGVRFQETNLQICLIRISFCGGEHRSADDRGRIQNLSLEIIEQNLGDEYSEIYARNVEDYIIFRNMQEGRAAADLLSNACQDLRDALNVDVSYGFSSCFSDYSQIPEMYNQAVLHLQDGSCTDSSRPLYVRLCEAYIRDHYMEQISLQSAAFHIGITPNYLSTLFAKTTGESFTTALNRYRIEKVKRLLLKSCAPSKELGRQVGILNESYFIRTFRRFTGMTPNQYREQDLGR